IQAQPIDGRADVYSLACMFFECLTGAPPFTKATEVATIYAQLSEEPPSLAGSRVDLPNGLDPVLRKALAKNREHRYPMCGVMMKDVRAAVVQGSPKLGEPSGDAPTAPPTSFN